MKQVGVSTALAEQAAGAACDGDLETARDLAEKSAQAMTGAIGPEGLPEPIASPNSDSLGKVDYPEAVPNGLAVPVGAAAVVSVEANLALDRNIQAVQEAKQKVADAESFRETKPAHYKQVVSQAQESQQVSENNLRKLKDQLIYYRNKPTDYQKVIVSIQHIGHFNSGAVSAPSQKAEKSLVNTVVLAKKALLREKELMKKLNELRSELEITKMVLKRLIGNIQLNNKLFNEWQDEASLAVSHAEARAHNFVKDILNEKLFNLIKWKFKNNTNRVNEIEKIEDLIETKNFTDWAKTNKHTWEDIGKGLVSAIEAVPIVSKEVKTVAKATQNIIGSAYDISAWFISWKRIDELDKNSTRYLKAVDKSSVKMKNIITRINEVKKELAKNHF
ncbi:MAG: hypothetical protein GXP56_09680 [Deltaproteobacteria bacterium]|nr:hypothetical protein [Deltaproteobacteria bacterium]